jgi:zinc transporter ZupT
VHVCDQSNTDIHHKEIEGSESICCHSDHAKQLICSPALTRSGIILLVALSLHKLPEGIAIGAAGTHNITLGIILAFTAILHCLPEGMAIGAPLICGGMSKKKAIFLTALGGTPTIIGGAIGMLVGGISDRVLAFVLTIAAGTMLFVVFGEIIPQSLSLTKSKLTSYAAMVGILVGLLAVFVFASPICPHGHNHSHNHPHTHECDYDYPHAHECDYDH